MVNLSYFFIINASILISSYLIISLLLKIKETSDFAASLILVYFSQIILVETLLGISGNLRFSNILLFCLIESGICFLLYKMKKKAIDKFSFFEKLKKELGCILKNIGLRLLFSISILYLGTFLIWGLITPPPPWDSFMYHLYFPARWFKEGKFSFLQTPFGGYTAEYFPANGSLFYLWMIFPFSEDFMTNISQLLLYSYGVICLYGICRKLGFSVHNSFLASVVMIFPKHLMKEYTCAEVELMFASFYIGTLNFLLQLFKKKDFSSVLLFSISCGCMFGIDRLSLPYGTFLILPFMFFLVSDYFHCIQHRRLIIFFLTFLLFTFIFCGFWYVRNYLKTGSPFYPLSTNEIITTPIKWATKPMENKNFRTLSHYLNELRYLVNCLYKILGTELFIIITICLFLSWMNFPKNKNIINAYLFFLPIVLGAIFLQIKPNSDISNARFILAPILLSFVYVASALENKKVHFYLKIAIYLLVYISLFKNERLIFILKQLINSFNFNNRFLPIYGARIGILIMSISIVILSVGLFLWNTNQNHKKQYNQFLSTILELGAFLLLFLSFTVGNFLIFKYYRASKYNWYLNPAFPTGEGWYFIEKVFKNPINIAFSGNNMPYALFGTNFKNNVYYINVNKHPKWTYFDYVEYWKNKKNIPNEILRLIPTRREMNYSAWISNLKRENIDVLFVTIIHQQQIGIEWIESNGFPIEDFWARKNPNLFKRIYENKHVHIYLFLKK